jgi:hypothetical protein
MWKDLQTNKNSDGKLDIKYEQEEEARLVSLVIREMQIKQWIRISLTLIHLALSLR